MPVLYRKWAMTCLRQLSHWVEPWRHEAMFAGMPGISADDAWFLTAMDIEYAQIAPIPFIGGSVGLFKCFDQVIRCSLYIYCY